MTETNVHRYPKGRRPKFSDHPAVDELMSMIMVLSSEVSVLRDRLNTFEILADRNNFIDKESLEKFEPDESTLQAREAARQEFFERLFFVASKHAQEIGDKDDDKRYRRVLDDIAKSDD